MNTAKENIKKNIDCLFDINLRTKEQITERKKEINDSSAHGFIHEITSADGISIGYYNLHSDKEGMVSIDNQTPYFQLSFNLIGKKTYSAGLDKKPVIALNSQQYNYLWMEKGLFQLSWPANHKLETFELSVKKEFFEHLLPYEHPFREQIHNLNGNEAFPLAPANLPLTFAYSSILFDIFKCPLEGHLKRLYIHAKTIELITLQLEEFNEFYQLGQNTAEIFLSKKEIDRMYLAREIIIKNSNLPCTLIDLAHNIGTNDAYLKKHFKMVFGTTVFTFLMEHKMNKAKELLLEGIPITKVAHLTGYNQPSHFSRAFKKYFNISPNKVKNRNGKN